jgi:DNA polymerase-3 subunit epsilon
VVHERRPDGAEYLGPLRSRRHAEQLRDAIHDAVPLRQCTDRLVPARPVRSACALAGIGRCPAPCEDSVAPDTYAELVQRVLRAWHADVGDLIEPLRRRLDELSAAQRYEEAAVLRDRIATLVRSCSRTQSLVSITSIGELVAARPDGAGSSDPMLPGAVSRRCRSWNHCRRRRRRCQTRACTRWRPPSRNRRSCFAG